LKEEKDLFFQEESKMRTKRTKTFRLRIFLSNKSFKEKSEGETFIKAIRWRASEAFPRDKAKKINLFTEGRKNIIEEVDVILLRLWRGYKLYIFKDGLVFSCERISRSNWFIQETNPYCEKTGKFATTVWNSAAALIMNIEK